MSLPEKREPDDRKILVVDRWHTECGECGYGRGGWASSPAREGNPILTPESRVCYGCNCVFTHVDDAYSMKPPQPVEPVRPIPPDEMAA